MNNVTYGTGHAVERAVHVELVYVVASLLVALVSTLVASFLGLRRRRNVSTARPSIHEPCSGSDAVWKDVVHL